MSKPVTGKSVLFKSCMADLFSYKKLAEEPGIS